MQLIDLSQKKRKQNFTTPTQVNRVMNNETYKLRREVMKLIYEAKELLNGKMERVKILITDNKDNEHLGVARMGGKIIWIPATTIDSKYLREVVYHELCHALWCVPHIETCKLMSSRVGSSPLSKITVQRLFLKYAELYSKEAK